MLNIKTLLIATLSSVPMAAMAVPDALPWQTYSGANCTSDLASAVTGLGGLENLAPRLITPTGTLSTATPEYTTFQCPMFVPAPYAENASLSIYVMGTNGSRTDKPVSCTATTWHPMVGTTAHATATGALSTVTYPSGASDMALSVALPPPTWGLGGLAVAHLRCKVYHAFPTSARGAIFMYRVAVTAPA